VFVTFDTMADPQDEDEGDFEPMPIFQDLPGLLPPTPKRSLLDSMGRREVNEDQDMSEFILSQESMASIVSFLDLSAW
jgi:hypothetical protein